MRRFVVLALAGLALAACAQRQEPTGSAPTGASPAVTPPAATSPPTSSPAATPPAATSQVPAQAKLSPHGADVLARARKSGAEAVVLTISTEPGRADRVADHLRALGATVESSDTATGYVRASVPVGLAEQAASAEGVSRVDVDEPLGNADPTP